MTPRRNILRTAARLAAICALTTAPSVASAQAKRDPTASKPQSVSRKPVPVKPYVQVLEESDDVIYGTIVATQTLQLKDEPGRHARLC